MEAEMADVMVTLPEDLIESVLHVIKSVQPKHHVVSPEFQIVLIEELERSLCQARSMSFCKGVFVQTDRLLQFFTYSHLPAHLQDVSKPFCDLAGLVCDSLPSNPERTVALRKLLESKDCAVRAILYKEPA